MRNIKIVADSASDVISLDKGRGGVLALTIFCGYAII